MKIKNILLLLCLYCAIAAHGQNDTISLYPSEIADRIIDDAMSLLKVPYRYGAKGPRAYDCSGLTQTLFRRYGFELERTSAAQAKQGQAVEGDWSNLQKGDLIIFSSRHNKNRIGHVGIFIAADSTGNDFTFIHAAVKGGVQVSRISEEYYKKRFLGVRRILPEFITAYVPDTTEISTREPFFNDTLTLGDNDKRIILFENGSWLFVDSNGDLQSPNECNKIILEPDGRWSTIPMSKRTLPTPELLSKASIEADDEIYHTIKSGDSLSKIAARYHTSVNALCRLNGIKTTTTLRIGKKIRVR